MGGVRREPSLPVEYIPELEVAAQRAGLNWKDFQLTDNSCKPHPPAKSLLEKVRRRFLFACSSEEVWRAFPLGLEQAAFFFCMRKRT